MIRLRLPNITPASPSQQIVQLVNYLRQLVMDINTILDEIENKEVK